MKLGSANVLKAYLGSNEVSRAYLGSVQVYGGASPVLPYDAQVEYLESDGFAYILTNIYGSQNTGFEVKYYWENKNDWSFKENANNVLFGVRDASGNKNMLLFMNASTPQRFRFLAQKTAGGTNAFMYDSSTIIEGQHVVNYSVGSTNGTLKMDGTTLKTAAKSSSYTSERPLAIFTLNRNGVFDWVACAKIYYFKLYTLSELVLDMIPVRVGQVGYLYDKISGNLFGNANSTGSFTIGNDVN